MINTEQIVIKQEVVIFQSPTSNVKSVYILTTKTK